LASRSPTSDLRTTGTACYPSSLRINSAACGAHRQLHRRAAQRAAVGVVHIRRPVGALVSVTTVMPALAGWYEGREIATEAGLLDGHDGLAPPLAIHGTSAAAAAMATPGSRSGRPGSTKGLSTPPNRKKKSSALPRFAFWLGAGSSAASAGGGGGRTAREPCCGVVETGGQHAAGVVSCWRTHLERGQQVVHRLEPIGPLLRHAPQRDRFQLCVDGEVGAAARAAAPAPRAGAFKMMSPGSAR